MKLKRNRVVKWHDNERYTFINGVAVIPGTYYKHKPMTTTLREFKEALEEIT